MIKDLTDKCIVSFVDFDDEVFEGIFNQKENTISCLCGCNGTFDVDEIEIIEILEK